MTFTHKLRPLAEKFNHLNAQHLFLRQGKLLGVKKNIFFKYFCMTFQHVGQQRILNQLKFCIKSFANESFYISKNTGSMRVCLPQIAYITSSPYLWVCLPASLPTSPVPLTFEFAYLWVCLTHQFPYLQIHLPSA